MVQEICETGNRIAHTAWNRSFFEIPAITQPIVQNAMIGK